jgi:hypothetical protein
VSSGAAFILIGGLQLELPMANIYGGVAFD